MAIEGIKLAIIGITIVYLFLALLVATISLSARILRTATEKEQLALSAAKPRTRNIPSTTDMDARLVAIIGAALAAHRVKRKAR